MALTNELLASVEGLTDAQKATLVALSKNDEDRVISAKVKETHGLYDSAFEQLLGEKKRDGEKSTVFWAEKMKELKDQAAAGGSELKSQLEALRAEKESLEAKVKAGKGGEALEQQLADKDGLIKQLQKKLEETKSEWQGKYEQATKETSHLKIVHEFDKALAKMTFKSDNIIPSEVKETFIENAKSNILSQYQPDLIDDESGGKRRVFRKDGEIVRNPENSWAPYTAAELLAKSITPILDNGKEQNGAGTKPEGKATAGVAAIGAARSQSEAAENITQELMKRGLARGTDAYQQEFDKAWKENNVPALPIQ